MTGCCSISAIVVASPVTERVLRRLKGVVVQVVGSIATVAAAVLVAAVAAVAAVLVVAAGVGVHCSKLSGVEKGMAVSVVMVLECLDCNGTLILQSLWYRSNFLEGGPVCVNRAPCVKLIQTMSKNKVVVIVTYLSTA